jgi:hypothetical protein
MHTVTVTTDNEHGPLVIEVKDDDDFRKAHIKWDGCVHYHESTDEYPDEYLHICDLPGQIEFLQSCLAAARSVFGEEWPK